jgi:membrane associated rhomboid family serine protease
VLGGSQRYESTIQTYGFVPALVQKNSDQYYRFITSMFLHGGLIHLGGNMLYLYIFGDNLEDMCGHLSYLIFYLICGISASLLFMASAWDSTMPAIGASGAISGVLSGYVILFPKVRVMTAIPVGFFIRVVHVPAFVMISLWFVYQFLLAITGAETTVAYWAHVGGFLAGLVFVRVFARRKHYHPLYYKAAFPEFER